MRRKGWVLAITVVVLLFVIAAHGLALEFGSDANKVMLTTEDSFLITPVVRWGDNLIAPWRDGSTNLDISSLVARDGTISTLSALRDVSPRTTNDYDTINYLELSNGNLLVYWYSESADYGLTDAYFKIINTSGVQVVAATKINSDPGTLNRFVQAAELSDGKLAFVWATSESNYAFRRFTISGSTATAFDASQLSITDLAGLTGITQYRHLITANTGSFMIGISSADGATNYSYRGMLFTNSGTSPTQVEGSNAFVISERYEASSWLYVKTLSNGDYLAVYRKTASSSAAASTRSIVYKVFSASGAARAAENVYAGLCSWGKIIEPLIVDGGFILSYTYLDYDTDPDTYSEYLRYISNTDYTGASATNYDSNLDVMELSKYAEYDTYIDVDGSVGFIVNDDKDDDSKYEAFLLRADLEPANPTVSITSTKTSPTNASPIPVTITFSEAVTGFTRLDIAVSNGAADNLQTSDNAVFTADITPAGDGAVTVDVRADAATGNTSGKTNTASDMFSIIYDSTPPNPPTSLTAITPTNDTTPSWMWASGGGGSGYRRSYDNSTWTEQSAASFTQPSALSSGTHTLYVQERDAAGNWSASTSYTVTIDAVAPSITSASLAADNSYMDVFFSEGIYAASGSGAVEASDFSLTFAGNSGGATNVVLGTFAKTDGGALAGGESEVRMSLTVTGTPSGVETIEIKPAAGAVFDGVGNTAPTTATTGEKTLNDEARPSVAITSAQSGTTAENPIPVTITFSEAVTGFEAGEIDVVNGTAGNLQTSDNTVFTADITLSAGIADGSTITVDVAANVAADSASNQNTAATQFSIVYDTRVPNAPNVGITGTTASPTNDTTPTWVWESGGGDAVTGMYKVQLNAWLWFTSDTSYTVPGFSDGDFTLYVWERSAAGLWSDSGSHTITIDTTAPTVEIASAASNPTNAPFTVSITFSEAVTGFTAEDITVGNGAASNFSGTGASYSATITPEADGSVTVDIAADAAADAASNGNTAATQFSIVYDTTVPAAPVVTSATPTNDATPTWTWTTGGGGSGTYRYGYTDGSDWISDTDTTAAYTPASALADGAHTLYVQERDAAGNWSASGSFAITVDTVLPTVEITSDSADDTTLVTFTFSEDVTGFTLDDITVSSGMVGAFTTVTPNSVYSVEITHDNSADITASIAADRFADTAGNTNTAVAEVTVYTLITLEIVNSSPLPSGVKDNYYAQNFTATGNTGTVAWALKTGALPAGMAFSADGALTGTPTESGPFVFTVQVTDDVATVEKELLLTIEATAPNDAGWTSGNVFYIGSSAQLELLANLPYGSFVFVDVNGNVLTLNTEYLLREGSTIVNLLPDYLNTLAPGSYMLTLHWAGDVTRSLPFEVRNALPLAITQQPADALVLIGKPATFTVQASGTPPLSYAWSADYGFGWVPLSETSASYTISAAELSLSGAKFRVEVKDGVNGTLMSDTAVLTVTEVPQTGDATPLGLYSVLLVLIGLGMMAALLLKRKAHR